MYFLSGKVGFIRMKFEAGMVQNSLIENEIGANIFYKNLGYNGVTKYY
jgi:hypothetical protein